MSQSEIIRRVLLVLVACCVGKSLKYDNDDSIEDNRVVRASSRSNLTRELSSWRKALL